MRPNYSILLVDCDRVERARARRALAAPNYTLHEADTALDALDVLRASDIDAVVTAGSMPGMHGLDLLRRLQLTRSDVVRVLLTDPAALPLAHRALEQRTVHRFLVRPWDYLDLRVGLRTSLYALRARPAAAQETWFADLIQ
jgi:response regulator RpfG family c-di-GMP phosphodiesterase